VAVNCGALTLSLVEAELFGHEKGAFTGAAQSKAGWFEEAHGGTLFLDEVGDLPLAAQVKLLRVLQEREVVRVGARRAIPVDVRVIAATNARLEEAVADGRFREDLFYRLHVAHLAIAPLRERPKDLLPLARHFLSVYATQLGIERAELTEDANARLLQHPWPGNIRELENAMHHALLVASDGMVTAADLPPVASGPRRSPVSAPAPGPAPVDARASLEQALLALFEKEHPQLYEEIESILFRTAFRFSENNQLRTARLLGISRNIVRARLIQHGLLAASSRSTPEPEGGRTPEGSGRNETVRPTPEGSGRDETFATAPPASRPVLRVRIGHQPFGVLSLLKATGALEDVLGARGVAVDWVECATGMQLVDGLAVGALDLGVVGEAAPIFAQAARAPILYLAAEPPAPEGEAIVVLESSPIKALSDLRGKTLAVTRGANVIYFAARALEDVGLALTDVHVRAFPPLAARAAFARGEVDAWATWDPFLASAQQRLPTRVLRDARGLADNRAFYVARRGFAEVHREVIEAFVGQVGAVGRWANESRGQAARLLGLQVNLPELAIEAALARSTFDTRPMDDEAIASQQQIADALHRLQFITRPVDVWEAVWSPPWVARRSA
jgi:aliphatic sulfonates family ABC transporter substrate-binding protein